VGGGGGGEFGGARNQPKGVIDPNAEQSFLFSSNGVKEREGQRLRKMRGKPLCKRGRPKRKGGGRGARVVGL